MEKLIKEIEKLVLDLVNPEVKIIDVISATNILQQITKLTDSELVIAWNLYLIAVKKIRSNRNSKSQYWENNPSMRYWEATKGSRAILKELDEYLVQIAGAFISQMNNISYKLPRLAVEYEKMVESACDQLFTSDEFGHSTYHSMRRAVIGSRFGN